MAEEAPTEGQAQAPEGQGTAEVNWLDGLSEESKGLADVKGWESADKAIGSYRELEKFVGAAPEQLLKLPTDPDSEDWNGVYSRLGRPETSSDYKIDLPEGVEADEGFMNSAKEAFHKAGLSGQQAQNVVDLWQNQVSESQTAMNEAADLKSQTELSELKREWGNGYDGMIEQGKRAVTQFGIDQQASEEMETAMGTKAFMKLWSDIGSKLGEDKLEGQGAVGQTPAGANERISQLMMDESFMKSYMTPNVPGHDAAVKKMSDLHVLASA